MCHRAHEVEDSLLEHVFLFHPVYPGDWTKGVRPSDGGIPAELPLQLPGSV